MRSLTLTLDRRSLETLYLSFIRLLLEYGDLSFDNLTNFEHNELDKIQNGAARIVTGTTKLTSIENLYTNTGWQTLGNRRNIHKLFWPPATCIVCYQIIIMLVILVIRNSSHQRNFHARTNMFYNSYFPSTLRFWNELSESLRNAQIT